MDPCGPYVGGFLIFVMMVASLGTPWIFGGAGWFVIPIIVWILALTLGRGTLGAFCTGLSKCCSGCWNGIAACCCKVWHYFCCLVPGYVSVKVLSFYGDLWSGKTCHPLVDVKESMRAEAYVWGLCAFVLTYLGTFLRFKFLLKQVYSENPDQQIHRWCVAPLASHMQVFLAFGLPPLCYSLCLVSSKRGLPWLVHTCYLACIGLAVPYQVMPSSGGATAAKKTIDAWKLPLLGCEKTVLTEFYFFNMQLLWCGDQYLDAISVAIAFHVGYEYAAIMAIILAASFFAQVCSSNEPCEVLLGRAPAAMPKTSSSTLAIVRFLSENIPQIAIQVSLAMSMKGSTIFPYVSAGVSAFLALRELADSLVTLGLTEAAAAATHKPLKMTEGP